MTEVQETKNWLWKDIDWEKATPKDIEKVIKADGNANDIAWDGRAEWRNVSYYEHTPLELAVEAKNVEAVAYLLEHKADPNAVLASRHYEGGHCGVMDFPLLYTAIRSDNKKIIDLFFQYGADPYAFDPMQKPKWVLEGHLHNGYANSGETMSYSEHPLSAAIIMGNMDVLKKITSAPYEVPEACLKNIKVDNRLRKGESELSETRQYWMAFVDQQEKSKRKGLRKMLYEANKKGELSRKEEILEQLRGPKVVKPLRRPKPKHVNTEVRLDPEYMKRQEVKEKTLPLTRNDEADKYKELRRKGEFRKAREAHKALQAKRAKVLGK